MILGVKSFGSPSPGWVSQDLEGMGNNLKTLIMEDHRKQNNPGLFSEPEKATGNSSKPSNHELSFCLILYFYSFSQISICRPQSLSSLISLPAVAAGLLGCLIVILILTMLGNLCVAYLTSPLFFLLYMFNVAQTIISNSSMRLND